MDKMNKKITLLFLCSLLLLIQTNTIFACTGLYIGSTYTENGSTYYGRSEDIEDNYCKIFSIQEAKTRDQDEMYEDCYGFKLPYPPRTLRYTYIRDSYVYDESKDLSSPYAAAGVNEKGVSVSATVSISCNDEAGKADPLNYSGIREISIPSLILERANNAREGVKFLASLVEEYGAGESNALIVADQNEVWLMEILTGHQYVARKLSDNEAFLQPNITLTGVVNTSDKERFLVSHGLVSLAEEHGFLIRNEDGNIDVAKSYGAKPEIDELERYCQGLYYLAPKAGSELPIETLKTQNSKSHQIEPFLIPERKLTTFEVLRFFAYRGKGSSCDSDAKTAGWAIGNPNQAECHVFELRKGLPAELATLQWIALSDAEFSIFIPYYSAIIERTNPKYVVDSADYVQGSINWVFSEINAICYDWRKEKKEEGLGLNVKKYFEIYQQAIIEQQKVVDREMPALFHRDPELAGRIATELGEDLAEQVYSMAESVYEDLNNYIERGDYSSAFVPKAMRDELLPEYSLKRIELYNQNQNRTMEPSLIFFSFLAGCAFSSLLFFIWKRSKKERD